MFYFFLTVVIVLMIIMIIKILRTIIIKITTIDKNENINNTITLPYRTATNTGTGAKGSIVGGVPSYLMVGGLVLLSLSKEYLDTEFHTEHMQVCLLSVCSEVTGVSLSVYVLMFVPVCACVCLSVRLSVWLLVCLSVCLIDSYCLSV